MVELVSHSKLSKTPPEPYVIVSFPLPFALIAILVVSSDATISESPEPVFILPVELVQNTLPLHDAIEVHKNLYHLDLEL